MQSPSSDRSLYLVRWVLTCAMLAASACATPKAPELVEQDLDRTLTAAERQLDEGRPFEALELVEVVGRVDPTYPPALALRSRIGDVRAEYLRRSPSLGSNVARRPDVERSLALRVALYVPDRILDLLDVVSLDVHAGFGLYANVHLTRAAQLGGGGRAVSGLGIHDHGSLGGLAQVESGVAVPGTGTTAYVAAAAGTSGTYLARDITVGPQRPTDIVYQTFRDYWAVGADFTYALFGLDIDLHPLQLADWIAGFAAVDFLHDDFATTRGLELTSTDRQLIRRVYSVLSSPETMALYAEHASQRKP